MKTALITLFCLSLALAAGACNFASLSDPPKMSKAETQRNQGRIHRRINQGAFRPISHAPRHPHGG